MSKKIALDLFSGTGSATKPFRESDDWDVIGVDKNPDIETDIEKDVLDLKPSDFDRDIDFIWASPPCKKFSVAAIGHHWNKVNDNYFPEKKGCVEAVRVVYHTLWLIQSLSPEYWFMENPRGMLRSLIGMPSGTVTYCQFGDDRMKPTDLWGRHPDNFEYRSCSNGSDCHTASPRGSKTGTQGRKSVKDRWRVPQGLAEHVFETVNEGMLEDDEE